MRAELADIHANIARNRRLRERYTARMAGAPLERWLVRRQCPRCGSATHLGAQRAGGFTRQPLEAV